MIFIFIAEMVPDNDILHVQTGLMLVLYNNSLNCKVSSKFLLQIHTI